MKNILYKAIMLTIVSMPLINAMEQFQQGLGDLRENLKSKWSDLTPTQKRLVEAGAALGAAGLATGAGALGYYLTKESPEVVENPYAGTGIVGIVPTSGWRTGGAMTSGKIYEIEEE